MDEKASQDAIRSEGSPPPATNALSFDPRDLIPTPIFCATPDGRLVWMNAAAEQLTGRLAPAISGEPFTILFPEEGRRAIARRFIRNRRSNVFEIEPVRRETRPSSSSVCGRRGGYRRIPR